MFAKATIRCRLSINTKSFIINISHSLLQMDDDNDHSIIMRTLRHRIENCQHGVMNTKRHGNTCLLCSYPLSTRCVGRLQGDEVQRQLEREMVVFALDLDVKSALSMMKSGIGSRICAKSTVTTWYTRCFCCAAWMSRSSSNSW